MVLETPKGTDAAGRDWDRINLRGLRTIARQVAAGSEADDNQQCGAARDEPMVQRRVRRRDR